MTRYKCPKCKMEYDAPGKCDMCKVTLEKIEEKETRMHNQHHDHANHHQQMVRDFKKRFIISAFVTIPILLLSPLIQQLLNFSFDFPGEKYVLFALSSFIFFYGGRPFLKGFFEESRKKQPGMMILIALAISVAYFYSSAVVFGLKGKFFFWELATLIDVMLLGHWFEMKSVIGASKALEKLAQLMPDTAHLLKGSKVKEVKISALKKGDKILIKAGEKIPADGLVIKGNSYIDESMLTGESRPVHKKLEDKVIGGSVNGDGILEVRVEGTGEESYLTKVINLVKSGLPIVCVDRGLTGVDVDVVLVENKEGAFTAVNHLAKNGYKRIAYISGLSHLPSSRQRELGYIDALEANKLPLDRELIRYGDSSHESGVRLCEELLNLAEPADAIFTGNNLITLGALETIHKRRLNIPKDIAIIGFDDMYWSISLNPPLTAVRQPAYEIGKRAAELLIQRINDPVRPTVSMILKTELMIRNSC